MTLNMYITIHNQEIQVIRVLTDFIFFFGHANRKQITFKSYSLYINNTWQPQNHFISPPVLEGGSMTSVTVEKLSHILSTTTKPMPKVSEKESLDKG